MKTALFAACLGLTLLPARAEDWIAADGKVYQDVQVLSHNAAYVTILYKDGGGRIPLTLLKPELQKRFGYDPAKAPAIIAATQAADQRDQKALAAEKKRIQAGDDQRMKEVSMALASALFAPVQNVGPGSTETAPARPQPAAEAGWVSTADTDYGASTDIDDGDYGDSGSYGYGGYAGYGFGGHGRYGGYHGSHRGGWGNHFVGGGRGGFR
jgi:hypothetical protein